MNVYKVQEQACTWPNSAHGRISLKFKNGASSGMGIMIGPNVVLTAGSNLYSHQHKAYAELGSIKFLPGMDGEIPLLSPVSVCEYFVSPNYIKEEREDYGILILKEPIGHSTGYFGLSCLTPEEIEAKRVNVPGCSEDQLPSKSNNFETWGINDTLSCINKDESIMNFLIDADTNTNQNGGGIWYQEGDDYYVCGIHISKKTSFVNTATFLTRDIYQQIYQWLNQEVTFKEPLLKLGETKKLQFTIDPNYISVLMNYNLNDLISLDLSESLLGDKGAKVLAKNTSWTNLSQLGLRKTNCGASGAKALVKNTSWINLSHFDLSHNKIGTEGIKALAQDSSWISLAHLNLALNNIDSEGAKALAKNSSWVNLFELKLDDNKFDAEGAKGLAQNTSWVKLSKLHFTGNPIDKEGAELLAQNTSWVNLSEVFLWYNYFSVEEAKELRNTYKVLRIS